MRQLLAAALAAAFSAAGLAQDKITLNNGDVLTGTIKTMADGKVTIATSALGDVIVPFANITDMQTQAVVDLETKAGEKWKRRVLGIEGGALQLEGDIPGLALDNLARINPPEKPEPSWTGSLRVNGLWTDGNTDRRAIGMAFDASMRRVVDRFSVDATWDYSEDKDNDVTSATFREWKLNQRRAGGGMQYDYFLSQRWYALVTARVLGDTLADINLRFTGGTGVGYMWIEDVKTTFLTEVGVSYLNENYRSATPSVDFVAARLAYKLTQQLGKDTKLVHSVEAFPSTENIDDTYLTAKTEITTSLTDSMLASLAHIADWDNVPAPGRERLDNRVILSIGWTF